MYFCYVPPPHSSPDMKGIVPASAVNIVKELFVPESGLEQAKQELASLPSLDITKVCLGVYIHTCGRRLPLSVFI